MEVPEKQVRFIVFMKDQIQLMLSSWTKTSTFKR